jgi:membrane protein
MVGKTTGVLKRSANSFFDDNVLTLSAALAFYTIFSIAPLLVIAVYVAGAVLGSSSAHQQVMEQVRSQIGPGAASTLSNAMKSVQSSSGMLSLVLGIILAVVAATGAFSELQSSLNIIWKVRAKPGQAIWTIIRKRLLTLLMVAIIGLLLLASMLLSTALSAVKGAVSFIPGSPYLWQGINYGVTFVITALLFAAIYKVLPDVHLTWKDVWLDGVITAILFSIGKFGISLYLGHTSAASAFGVAGSLAVLLLWIYYSSIVFLLGAELSEARVLASGREIQPTKYAEKVPSPEPPAQNTD